MKHEIVKLETPELLVIEKSKAEQIKATFVPMVEMLEAFEDRYSEVISESKKEITKDVTTKAKRLRIDIGRVRIETEKVRKEQKEEYLRAGNAIDGVSNILKWAVIDKENRLKEIENYFEIQEQKRLEELQAKRADMLSAYVEDAHERNLSGMEEDVWNAYFQAKKKEYEDRIEAEKKAEQERIELELKKKKHIDREYSVRDYGRFFDWDSSNENLNDDEWDALVVKAEKAKLKYEAEQEKIKADLEKERLAAVKREKEIEAERKKRAKEEAARLAKEKAERQAREEKERKEREVFEAKLRAEREAREKIEREERAKREKLESELRAKAEAEQKAKEAEEARVQAELSKGDAAKVKDLISDLENIKAKYSFKSAKNKKMYNDVSVLIDKVIGHIKGLDQSRLF